MSTNSQDLLKTDRKTKLSEFTYVRKKHNGSRWGFIGKFGEDEYLIKREMEVFSSEFTLNCMVVLECLCSKIISKTIGKHYVAETKPVEIDCEKLNMGGETVEIEVEQDNNYAVASKWLSENYLSGDPDKVVNHTTPENYMMKLVIICNLLDVDDLKSDHYIKYTLFENGEDHIYRAIIDCAGELEAFKKQDINSFLSKKMYQNKIVEVPPEEYGLVQKIFVDFLDINMEKECLEYQEIPSPNFITIKNNLIKTQKHVRDNLLPQLDNLIKNETNKEQENMRFSI